MGGVEKSVRDASLGCRKDGGLAKLSKLSRQRLLSWRSFCPRENHTRKKILKKLEDPLIMTLKIKTLKVLRFPLCLMRIYILNNKLLPGSADRQWSYVDKTLRLLSQKIWQPAIGSRGFMHQEKDCAPWLREMQECWGWRIFLVDSVTIMLLGYKLRTICSSSLDGPSGLFIFNPAKNACFEPSIKEYLL